MASTKGHTPIYYTMMTPSLDIDNVIEFELHQITILHAKGNEINGCTDCQKIMKVTVV